MTKSNLYKHVKRELELIEEDEKLIKAHLDIVEIFDSLGHSGSSAEIMIDQLSKLLHHKNLSPLTNDPDEWEFHGPDQWNGADGIWQNKRNGEAFSTDGGETYWLLSERKKINNFLNSEVNYKLHRSRSLVYESETVIVFEEFANGINYRWKCKECNRFITTKNDALGHAKAAHKTNAIEFLETWKEENNGHLKQI